MKIKNFARTVTKALLTVVIGAVALVVCLLVFSNIRYNKATTGITDDNRLRITANVGTGSLGSGSSTYTVENEKVMTFDSDEHLENGIGPGMDCKHLYYFRPVSEGKTTITINYRNFHEDTVRSRTYDVTVGGDMSVTYTESAEKIVKE